MDNPRVYLCGPTTDMDWERTPFVEAAALATAMWSGAVIINPTQLETIYSDDTVCKNCHDWRDVNAYCCHCLAQVEMSFEDYRAMLLRDLALIATCDKMVILEGWEKSIGCLCEITRMLKLRGPESLWFVEGDAIRQRDNMTATYDIDAAWCSKTLGAQETDT